MSTPSACRWTSSRPSWPWTTRASGPRRLDRHNPGLARRFGESFLEKIAQITVAIPEPSLEGLNRLLSSITGNVLPAQSAVDEAAIQRAVTLFQAAPLSNPIEVEQRRADVERRIPDVSAGAIREAMRRVRTSLLTTDSMDVARAEFALLQHLPRNPRTVKRFDNAFRLQLLVANNTPGCELDFRYEEIEALGRWIALRFGWPDLAGVLDRRPSLLVKLDQLANGEPVSDPSELGAWKGDERLMALLKVERTDARVSRLPFQSFVNIR